MASILLCQIDEPAVAGVDSLPTHGNSLPSHCHTWTRIIQQPSETVPARKLHPQTKEQAADCSLLHCMTTVMSRTVTGRSTGSLMSCRLTTVQPATKLESFTSRRSCNHVEKSCDWSFCCDRKTILHIIWHLTNLILCWKTPYNYVGS